MADQSLKPTTRLFCCIHVAIDKACLIFAVISAIKWALLSWILTGVLVDEPSAGAIICFICVIIALIFSLILCKGTYKRRPDLLKIYMTFAVGLIVLILGLIILYTLLTLNIIGGLFLVLFLGLYSRNLLLIKKTYELFLSEQNAGQLQLIGPEPSKAYNSMEASAPEEP